MEKGLYVPVLDIPRIVIVGGGFAGLKLTKELLQARQSLRPFPVGLENKATEFTEVWSLSLPKCSAYLRSLPRRLRLRSAYLRTLSAVEGNRPVTCQPLREWSV